jgi:hypothetical protein
MTTLGQLQQHLKDTKRYSGAIDGQWGKLTEAGILLMLSDGPDTALTEQDYKDASVALDVPVAHIKAMFAVESGPYSFIAGRPVILPEPHYFSRLTNHKFDSSNPSVSYPKWGQKPYPKTQDQRYTSLLKMISLDVDAGFASASYGKPQILGDNCKACGYNTSWLFAEAMARDERTQLIAFEKFIKSKGLQPALKTGNWTVLAKGYNGPAYAKNNYDTKLRDAAKRYG